MRVQSFYNQWRIPITGPFDSSGFSLVRFEVAEDSNNLLDRKNPEFVTEPQSYKSLENLPQLGTIFTKEETGFQSDGQISHWLLRWNDHFL